MPAFAEDSVPFFATAGRSSFAEVMEDRPDFVGDSVRFVATADRPSFAGKFVSLLQSFEIIYFFVFLLMFGSAGAVIAPEVRHISR